MRFSSFLPLLLLAVAEPAAAQPPAASPVVPMGPNPSECEIQAALLGTAGPGCSAVILPRGPAPAPGSPAATGPTPPPAVALPAPVAPAALPNPVLRAAFRVEFDFNSARIRPESRETLDRVAAVMTAREAGRTRFRIVGHTDAVGGDSVNLALSRKRAQAVVDYLVTRHQVRRDRLEASGLGARELLLPEEPKAAANRRVEIVNLGE